MSKTEVRYISAIPGLGKTHWAIGDICRQLREGETSLYVAPTIRLLQQVYQDFKKRLTKEEMKLVFVYHSKNTPEVSVQVTSVLSSKKIKPGTIVLTTQEAFLRLRIVRAFKQVNLYFDEARKIVSKGKRVKLSASKAQKLFRSMFDLEERIEGSSFRKVICKAGADATLRKDGGFATSRELVRQYNEIERLFSRAKDPRYEVFLRFPKEADEQERGGSSFLMKHHSFYEIVLPSKIFEGFKNVVVLAAHFEDSQMYHLLNETEGVKLIDIKHVLGDRLKARFASLVDRYKAVTIVPLTTQHRALSKHQLVNQLLAPDRCVDEILDKIGTASGIRKSLRALSTNSAYELPPAQSKAVKYLKRRKDVVFDVVRWYIKSAQHAIELFMSDDAIQGLPLLVLNDLFAKDEDYLRLLRDLKDRPTMELLTLMNNGLNSYRDRNVIAFVAAVNPHPDMVQFYKERLPDYDFEKDHVADVCVQSVCRLSLRDPSAKEKVLVVVPDLAIASLLDEKMFDRATVAKEFSGELGSMVSLANDVENRYGKEYAERNRTNKKTVVRSAVAKKQRAESPIKARLATINSLLSRHRSKANAGDARAKTTVDMLLEERELIHTFRKRGNMTEREVLHCANNSVGA